MKHRLILVLPFVLMPLASVPTHAEVTLGRLFATPAERAAMEATRGASAALAPNSQGQQPVPGTPGAPPAMGAPDAADGAAAKAPPAPPELVMSGVLRRSDNRTTVWLNNEPQYGAQRSTSQKKGAATPDVTVTLPSGKKIILKAGQRYDLNDGRIKDINEP